jgi:hypothetical protein
MHRQFSLQPFSRHYSHSTNPFLDLLEIDEPPEGSTAAPSISVTPLRRDHLLEVLKTYKLVQKAGTMLTLNFVTVNDYLWLLRAVSQELSVLGKDAMYYLAAAVSDFFLPRQKMVFLPCLSCLAHSTFADLATVSPQDSIGEGKPAHRDGSSAKDLEAHGGRVDPAGFCRVLQGEIVRPAKQHSQLTFCVVLAGDGRWIAYPQGSSCLGEIRSQRGYRQ